MLNTNWKQHDHHSKPKANAKLAKDVLSNTKKTIIYNSFFDRSTDAENAHTEASQNNYTSAILGYKLAEIHELKKAN
jgi:hypothetical protein